MIKLLPITLISISSLSPLIVHLTKASDIEASPKSDQASLLINAQASQIFRARVVRLINEAGTLQAPVHSFLTDAAKYRGQDSVSQFELQKIINIDPGQILSYFVALNSYTLWQENHSEKGIELENTADDISKQLEHLRNLDKTDTHLKGMDFAKVDRLIQGFESLRSKTKDIVVVLKKF
jgi:hypothetical protein